MVTELDICCDIVLRLDVVPSRSDGLHLPVGALHLLFPSRSVVREGAAADASHLGTRIKRAAFRTALRLR